MEFFLFKTDAVVGKTRGHTLLQRYYRDQIEDFLGLNETINFSVFTFETCYSFIYAILIQGVSCFNIAKY